MRIAVIGINTEVGKTIVSALLAEALGGRYWKPIQCGTPCDREWVQKHTNCICFNNGITLKAPVSPHLAARNERIRLAAESIVAPSCQGPLIIEGTGGLLSPINEHESWFDAALLWKPSDWVLVHRHYLGSLNHFFLTTAFLEQRKIPLTGVIFNGEGDRETEEMLLQRTKTRLLGRLSWQQQWSKELLQNLAKEWKPLLG